MPALAASLLLASWAAALPKYEPAPQADALKAAGREALQGVSRLLSTPVEPAKSGALKAAIAGIAAEGAKAAAAASALAVLGEPHLEAMAETLKGRGSVLSLDRRIEAAKEAAEALRGRAAAARARARRLEEEGERGGPGEEAEPEDPAERAERAKRRDALIRRALDGIDRASRRADEARADLEALEDRRSEARSEASRARHAREELEASRDKLGAEAASLQDAARRAAAAVEGLAREPLHESRGEAYRAIDPVNAGGRSVFYHSDAAGNRGEGFAARYAAFVRAAEGFDRSEASLKDRLKEASGLVADAEGLLDRAGK